MTGTSFCTDTASKTVQCSHRSNTLFLKGIQSIVPDIEITDVKEDLSGMTEEMSSSEESGEMTDGTRGISFLCNGHPYAIELISYGDWINPDMIEFMNGVLAKENCPKRHVGSSVMCVVPVILP